jgi:predicted Zn finger-like uncharacterized protein
MLGRQSGDNSGDRGGDKVELECPECGARVKVTSKQAQAGKVRCPRGHEFAVMGILGGAGVGGPGERKR